MSRNSSWESQRRRPTTSLSMRAMWAAGPPNAVAPSRRKRAASSRNAARLDEGSPPSLGAVLHPPGRKPGVEGPGTGSHEEQEEGTQQHRVVCARLMGHAPESALQENRDLRRRNRDHHDREQRNHREPREKTEEDEQTAPDLDRAHKGRHHCGKGDPDLGEAPNPEGIGKEELL